MSQTVENIKEQMEAFLSENEKFSKVCQEHNIKFIGATPEQIAGMGDKASAKATMIAAGVPCIPGSVGLLKDLATKNLPKSLQFHLLQLLCARQLFWQFQVCSHLFLFQQIF